MGNGATSVQPHQLGINQGEECERQLDVDLGHLLAVHPSAPDDPAVLEGSDAALKAFATKCAQSLVRQIFSLPSHASEAGRAVALPPPAVALPRAKPLPQPKPLTKWQKFAQEKGIVKRKKSKLDFDETSQDWKRRHGYGRANDPAAVPVIEASAADEGFEDPFERMEHEKQASKKRGRKDEAAAAAGSTVDAVMPATVKLTSRLDPGTVKGQIAKGKALKGDIAKASELAGVSTASMGKFDARLKGEKGARKLPGMRKTHLPTAGGDAESGMVATVLGKVTRKEDGELVDVRRAVGNLQASKARRRDGEDDAGDGEERAKRKKGRVGRVKNRRVPKKTAAQKAGSSGISKTGKTSGKKRK